MDELHPTKKLIFDAIAQLLAEEGIDGVTYSNISVRTYLQRASIAYHFKGRQDMLMQYFGYFLTTTDNYTLLMELIDPPTNDPVADFCRVMDTVLLHENMQDPAAEALYRHVLTSAVFDPQAKKLLRQSNEQSEILLQKILNHYIKAGIIEERHIELAVADVFAFAACSSFVQLFEFDIPKYDLALKAMIERVKRMLLKEGLYPLRQDFSGK